MELAGVPVLSLSALIPKGTWGKPQPLSLHHSLPRHSGLAQSDQELLFAQSGTDEPADPEELETQAVGRNKGQEITTSSSAILGLMEVVTVT